MATQVYIKILSRQVVDETLTRAVTESGIGGLSQIQTIVLSRANIQFAPTKRIFS
jgi:hypothetical protein